MTRAVLCLLLLAPATAAQAQTALSFAELVRAHVDARVGFERLPAAGVGQPLIEPDVFVTVTTNVVLLYGTTLATLEAGRPAPAQRGQCGSGAACLPALRDGVRRARAELARDTKRVPQVLVIAAREVPYATVLDVVRSVAEAGAARSIQLAVRRDEEILGIRVWVTPGRQIGIGSAANPALIASEIDGGGGATVYTTRFYSRAPRRARTTAAALAYLGELQLQSGRTTHFVYGSANARAGDIIGFIGRASAIFPHVALTGRGERNFKFLRR